ncbi:MAG: hypothetical protein RLZZ15_4495 [Verrucomicrobiota bacterium]|jgi:hypothetical protein
MPIYEYYCQDNHTIYQFYAKTLAQGQRTPRCPDNPKFKLKKLVSAFAVTSGGKKDEAAEHKPAPAPGDAAEDARMEAAMGAMEKEFSAVDENDPKAMARMMRRMGELTGEKFDEPMEEAVRKLEEGADPDSLEDSLGGDEKPGEPDPYGDDMGMGGPPGPAPDPKEPRHRFRVRRLAPRRDPQLYDYD